MPRRQREGPLGTDDSRRPEHRHCFLARRVSLPLGASLELDGTQRGSLVPGQSRASTGPRRVGRWSGSTTPHGRGQSHEWSSAGTIDTSSPSIQRGGARGGLHLRRSRGDPWRRRRSVARIAGALGPGGACISPAIAQLLAAPVPVFLSLSRPVLHWGLRLALNLVRSSLVSVASNCLNTSPPSTSQVSLAVNWPGAGLKRAPSTNPLPRCLAG